MATGQVTVDAGVFQAALLQVAEATQAAAAAAQSAGAAPQSSSASSAQTGKGQVDWSKLLNRPSNFGEGKCKSFTASDIPVFTCHSCIHVSSSNSNSFYVILRRFLSRENKHGSGAVICLPFGCRELQYWGQDPHPQTR